MNMNKFFLGLALLLAGCGGGFNSKSLKEPTLATTAPTDVQQNFLYSTSLYGSDDSGPRANIAVLLPTSGLAKTHGNNIKTSVETAFLRSPKTNIKISFFDLSGNLDERYNVINQALSSDPDIIIGPLFAEDTRILRDIKPDDLPVISFTSDSTSLGNGVMTINLIPTQSIETIVRQMQIDGAKGTVILAPNDNSGQIMASVADTAATIYGISVKEIFYYEPGKSDSIKDVAMRSSLYKVRNAANIRAREILSDILTNESLSENVRGNLSKQLEKISRTETLGELPFDSVLFLGNAEDSKTLASFLRYYGINNRNIAFYGTTLWHDSVTASDFTLSGAKYATLPEMSQDFTDLYTKSSGKTPDHLAAMGFDATNLALGMIYSNRPEDAYLFDPNGYIGANGAFRIQPDGQSERTLRVMALNGSGTPVEMKPAPNNFLVPLYSIDQNKSYPVYEKEISEYGVNPGDYITIPEELSQKPKYKTKTIWYDSTPETKQHEQKSVQIISGEKETISDPDFKSAKKESVSRKYIDSVEITE